MKIELKIRSGIQRLQAGNSAKDEIYENMQGL